LGNPAEITVLETLRCPGCSTRFALGAARVRPGIRRAQCFRCDTVFDIEEAVARLLAPDPDPESPSLSLEDLQGLPEEPEAAAEPAGPGYASAKDAIARLMGDAPAASAPMRMGSRSTLDVDATLDALSSTLGAPAKEPETPAGPRKSDLSSTVKLTPEEIRVAMASVGEPVKPPAPMPPAPVRPVPAPAENPPLILADPAQAADLLKIQLEQETCNNVTIEQMTAWIEQGRVLEYHMVARQYSEHWIEASKVPALRPVFDRMRRIREAQAEEPSRPAPEPAPVKRGLFSGLFGRN
jgi:hypothetical protein